MDLPIRKVCFAEIVGIGRKTDRALAKLRKKIDAMPSGNTTFFKGVSPHAPYSTGPEVYREAISLAAKRSLRLTTHLAEDPAEIEFLKTGGGPWREVLRALGLWDNSIKPFGGSPVEWAKETGLLDIPAILAHVNYVDDRDIELLANGKASVAYCPAAHRYFHHADHRYRDMIAAGVNVVLGNDSLACSPQLSILAQMQAGFQAGGLPARSVFAMGTTAAAKSLGLEKTIGSLAIGKRGDLAVLVIRRDARSILKAVLRQSAQVVLTMFEGRLLDSSR
jgi:cytosine/adenosine deaminase-related metal-dependent hydrolase